MKELVLEAKTENLEVVLDFIETEIGTCPENIKGMINIAAEEIFVNIASYAYAPSTGNAIIRCMAGDEIVMQFEDGGIPYNPLEKPDPDVTLGTEERKIGGLGIFMVKKIMDSVEYRNENGKNILTIKKSKGG